jgi:MFS family permease
MGSSNRPRSPGFILLIVFLASVAAPLNQFKVPPLMPVLMEAFQAPPGRAGLLMSVFAFTGLILALPAGFILQRLGHRVMGVLAVFSLAAGSALGASAGGLGTLLAGRLVEGVGMCFISVVAPAVIVLWFVPEARGRAMGIWGTWVPVGSTVMFMIAPGLARMGGWQAVWWVGVLYSVVVGLLYLLFIPDSPGKARAPTSSPAGGPVPGGGLSVVLRNRDLWLMSLVFCCFNIAFVGFLTWMPAFLHRAGGRSIEEASLVVSLVALASIVSGPLSGWVSDRIGSRRLICLGPMILMAFLLPLTARSGGPVLYLLALASGFTAGFVPTGVLASGPEAVGDERLSGMAIAVIQIGQNAGMLLGPLGFGWLVELTGSWPMAFWSLAIVSVVGAAAAWAARVR